MNRILLLLLTQPHVLLQVGFFKSCVIHSFNAHLSSPFHSPYRPCLELQHPLLKAHPTPSCHSARRACPELQNLMFQFSHLNLIKKSFLGWFSESEDGSQPHLFTESFHFFLGRFFRFLRCRPENCRQKFHFSHRIEEESLVG